jgi:hypothetical protein
LFTNVISETGEQNSASRHSTTTGRNAVIDPHREVQELRDAFAAT